MRDSECEGRKQGMDVRSATVRDSRFGQRKQVGVRDSGEERL